MHGLPSGPTFADRVLNQVKPFPFHAGTPGPCSGCLLISGVDPILEYAWPEDAHVLHVTPPGQLCDVPDRGTAFQVSVEPVETWCMSLPGWGER